jgi:hypothetical protein
VVVVSHRDTESSPPTAVHHQAIEQNQQQQLPLQELVLDDEQLKLDQDDSSESGIASFTHG